jgi:hypothetical protein
MGKLSAASYQLSDYQFAVCDSEFATTEHSTQKDAGRMAKKAV